LTSQLRVGGAVDLTHAALAELGGDLVGAEARADHHSGSVTLNGIAASCSGALPIRRKHGSQRGSFRRDAKSGSDAISARPGSWYAMALSSHSKARSASPRKAST